MAERLKTPSADISRSVLNRVCIWLAIAQLVGFIFVTMFNAAAGGVALEGAIVFAVLASVVRRLDLILHRLADK